MSTDELNIKCAEAMGLPAPFYSTMEMKFPGPQPGTYRGDVPAYTTSPAAALELVEALAKEWWRCCIDQYLDGKWDCAFWKLDGPCHCQPADTMPLAIVHAFLAVKGVTK